jgi:hypothetical protein
VRVRCTGSRAPGSKVATPSLMELRRRAHWPAWFNGMRLIGANGKTAYLMAAGEPYKQYFRRLYVYLEAPPLGR